MYCTKKLDLLYCISQAINFSYKCKKDLPEVIFEDIGLFNISSIFYGLTNLPFVFFKNQFVGFGMNCTGIEF